MKRSASSLLRRLKAAGARLDGLLIAADGTPSFAATNASGAWSEAEKQAVAAALGRAAPVPSPARTAALTAAIETWLDQTAQRLGYNNVATAVSYATSEVDLWRRQAMALAAWRDAVWQAAFARLAALPSPETAAALIATLPQPNIPTE